MRFSKMYIKTVKETPKDAEVVSHQLMLRAGMIKKLVSGVYSYLPLGLKVLRNIEDIVRQEMEKSGAQEILMPIMQPAELWKESSRWDAMGLEMMRLQDRNSRDFVLGPTHEEVITDIIRNDITSYKSLPKNLFQIQTKFRDERRPRFGLMRGREFLMKDAYSFHNGADSLDEEFLNMRDTYSRIFTKCGLKFRPVDADSGNIGGSGSQEFQALAESGEDEIIYCNRCDYAANIESAISNVNLTIGDEKLLNPILKDTPNISKITDVVEYLKVDISKTVKAMMYKNRDTEEVFMVLIRGDYEVNEVKLKNSVNSNQDLLLLTDEELKKLDLIKGYIGPFGMDLDGITIITDKTVSQILNHTAGGNILNTHYLNLNYGRDYKVDKVVDVKKVKVGEQCPKCSGILESARGIEVGQIFKLGDKYSKSMKATFLDQNGKSQYMLMGCYGIGVSRTLASIIEQHHDENGIIWPMSVAPYLVDIIPTSIKDEEQVKIAELLYSKLKESNIETILDDRNERPGFKFKDADLIGIPIKIVVGRDVKDGLVEITLRETGEVIKTKIDDVLDSIKNIIGNRN